MTLVTPTAPASSSQKSESAAHRELKRLAVEWARAHRLLLVAEEVRVPRSNYRADVAAATPRVLAPNAVTAIFECKASRADFLRDSAPEAGAKETIDALSLRLATLRALIGEHRPDLRRGEELFPEFDACDLRGLKHDTHARLSAELACAQRKLHDGTKFARLARWRAANLLYIVAIDDLFSPHELPDGWGLLIRRGDELKLVSKPCVQETSAEERVAFLERIAATAARSGGSRSRQID